MRRLGLLVLPAVATLVGAAWVVERVVALRRHDYERAEVEAARGEILTGRFDAARRRLTALPPARLDDPEAADLLGVCEYEAGRFEAALAAWERVPADSPRAPAVALARARTLVGDLGRFAEAEAILEAALPRAGPARLEMMHTLEQLYFWEFRGESMRRLIRESRDIWRNPSNELRDLWMIDDATVLVEGVRAAVDKAARLAPDDDRVRLARAGLDAIEGDYPHATKMLDDCLARRPDDPAVWGARLRLMREAGNVAEVERALAHLPADALAEADLLDLRAWLASKRGDLDDERSALERRIDLEPADPGACERLAVLDWKAGRTDRAAALRRRKADLDASKDRYRRLLHDRAPSDRFDELAQLAEQLNRPFEAYGWWSLAAREKPRDPAIAAGLARLSGRLDPPRPVATGTLAARLAALAPKSARTPTARAESSAPTAPASSIRFADDAGKAGLKFVFDNGRSPMRQLPETTAGGVGLLDYDGDGFLDVYVVQGGVFPPDPSRPNSGDRLFRNRRDGTFEDVSERSGIARMPRGYGHGVAVGDFDNDGRPDLFITRWRTYALYRNRGDGTFEDATARVGLDGPRDWPTSAAFADLDNDGDLDLYVCHYLDWDDANPKLCPRTNTNEHRPEPEIRFAYCMPNAFRALPDHLFRNDGGKFVDVTASAGIVDRDGRGLGVVAADVDDDGLVDLFVANDTSANYLFHNLGGMKFKEVGAIAGVACNAAGAYQAGMGTACGDLDGDGRFDLLVTNFLAESTSFFRNLGDLMFSDETDAVGLATPSRSLLGFGIALLDVNNDGRLDLAVTNGHVNDDRPSFPYEMPSLLMLGGRGGRLTDVTAAAGSPWTDLRLGRGLAVGDLDNDGRDDLIILPQNTPLAYFHNQTAGGRFLELQLEGTTSNRDAVGAVVSVTAGGKVQKASRQGGGSFQSARGPRLHFGLGDSARADRVEIRWPTGKVERFDNVAADAAYRVREGDGRLATLPGFQPLAAAPAPAPSP